MLFPAPQALYYQVLMQSIFLTACLEFYLPEPDSEKYPRPLEQPGQSFQKIRVVFSCSVPLWINKKKRIIFYKLCSDINNARIFGIGRYASAAANFYNIDLVKDFIDW